MAGWYELSGNEKGQYSFALKAGNAEVILRSEQYQSKGSAENGIASVQKNSPLAERYEKKDASDGRTYFNLKAANHEVIWYESDVQVCCRPRRRHRVGQVERANHHRKDCCINPSLERISTYSWPRYSAELPSLLRGRLSESAQLKRWVPGNVNAGDRRVHAHMSALRARVGGDDAQGRMPVLLSVPWLPGPAAPQGRPLLRVLFVWFGAVSTDSRVERLLYWLRSVPWSLTLASSGGQ